MQRFFKEVVTRFWVMILQEMVTEAATNSLKRLFPQFHIADHSGWPKVYEKARKGAPDALKSVGDEGEPAKNAVCKAILSFIAGGKKGQDIRSNFEDAPYGWSRDAVDGGLHVLLIAGLIRAQDEHGQTVDPKELERKAIGKIMFKVESTNVTTAQRIQIRKLFQKMGFSVKQGEELAYVNQFLEKLNELANRAGGDAPKPSRPSTELIDEIRLTAGNEQLISLFNNREELSQSVESWMDLSVRIEKKWPDWITLKRLIYHAKDIKDSEVLVTQITHIEEKRLLLEDQNLIETLLANTTQLLRDELNRLNTEYKVNHDQGMSRLKEDPIWQKLSPEQKNSLLSEQRLTLAETPEIKVADTDEVLATLEKMSLSALTDRVAALPSRFDAVLVAAAELMEPEAQFIKLPQRTIKTEQEIDKWLDDVKTKLQTALKSGPVIIH